LYTAGKTNALFSGDACGADWYYVVAHKKIIFDDKGDHSILI
jgi:hypothetical protein